ncbi:zinc-ribbon domain-containing protein [Mariprofundus sp. KV]|uniref:zinc-ribbon domain-containing protein n=1 Tax=Mariprofundus sp. KV TaxID=2608715 RepID=UPI0015A04290|nr:zinc-ribbon domain-containing protein [Mariprofundus sp. KV]NWF35577.1 hypothetical protein [Mariprofundus sp. KV]
MEFIQCPYCQKKYGVSDKLRRATGKRINCKHCQKTFIIFIQEKISQALQHKIDEQQHAKETQQKQHVEPEIIEKSAEPQKEPESEQKKPATGGKKKRRVTKKSARKPMNIQMVILVILGTLLIAGASGVYLYFYNHELFERLAEQPRAEPESDIKPFDPFDRQEKPDSAAAPQTPPAGSETEQPQTSAPAAASVDEKTEPEEITDDPLNPSQVCRDAAADYWIRTNMIANATLTNEAYIKLLNQGISLTDEVRTRCKERALVGRLAESARSEEVPEWIKKEIIARTSAKPDKRSKPSTPGF